MIATGVVGMVVVVEGVAMAVAAPMAGPCGQKRKRKNGSGSGEGQQGERSDLGHRSGLGQHSGRALSRTWPELADQPRRSSDDSLVPSIEQLQP